MPDQSISVFIESLLRESGRISLAEQKRSTVVNKSAKGEITTNVDRKLGAYIAEKIYQAFPDDSIVSEEVATCKQGKGANIWYIDPLDGTTNYVHRLPFFAISLGYYEKIGGKPLLSGVYIPYYDQLFMALASEDSTLNGKKINVSSSSKLSSSLILTGMSHKVQKEDKGLGAFIEISKCSAGTRRSGSAAFDLCYVAAGFADAYYHYNLRPWDIAAGAHIVKNSGGQITNIEQSYDFDITKASILGANNQLHAELLKTLISL